MIKLQQLNELADLFRFKEIFDQNKTSFIVFEYSSYSYMQKIIEDKTGFESFENHIHLLHRTPRVQLDDAVCTARSLGKAVLASLVYQFPERKFMVYVTIRPEESMILLFHQVWPNEEPFCDVSELENENEKEIVFLFKNE